MNKFIGSGLIMNIAFREENSGVPHTIISLGMRHKTRAGETRRETYRVSAWNTTALWAKDNLRVGQIVALLGYLTQRTTKDGHSATEIAAEEFIPSLQTSYCVCTMNDIVVADQECCFDDGSTRMITDANNIQALSGE